MRRITQRNDCECAVAALAMVTGLAIEEVEALLPFRADELVPGTEHPFGLWPHEDVLVLLRLGWAAANLWTSEHLLATPDYEYGERVRRGVWCGADDLRALCAGRRAILEVKSERFPGWTHAVAWDGHRAHDPNPEAPDRRRWEEYHVLGAVILFNRLHGGEHGAQEAADGGQHPDR